jgi:MFS transporter, MHS family, proline/betaine transporter
LMLIGASLAAAVGACGMGELSQHIGRKRSFLLMGAVRLVAFPVLFLAIGRTTDPIWIGVYALLLAFIANASYGPLLIFLNETFPTALRATGTGLSWNIGFALGGMLPTLVSLTADGPGQITLVLAIFSTLVTVVYLIGAVMMPETRGNLDRV